MATAYRELLRLLSGHELEFILIGGVAANVHGSARVTFDLDVVYGRSRENQVRLVKALAGHHAYLRGAPPGLPFRFDEKTVRMGLNFTLTTDLGELDLLGEVAGGGTYEALLPHSEAIEAFGVTLRVVTLERLIHLKRAAGRPKDLESIAELQALWEERRNRSPDK